MKTLFILMTIIMVSCVSNPTEVKKLDADVVSIKGQVGDRMVILDSKNNAKLHEEEAARDRLQRLENVNVMLRDDLIYAAGEVDRCRNDLADKRLGGTGEATEDLEIDNMRTPEQIEEKFGITKDGDLKFVTESDFLAKIKIEEKYQKSLRDGIKEFKKFNKQCVAKLRKARLSAGLPAEREEPRGYYKDGVFVRTSGNLTLDEEFSHQAKEKVKVKEPSAVVDNEDIKSQYDEYGNRK